MNTTMENELRRIAQKHELNAILGQLDATQAADGMRVVFLGEFSAGKSSLINHLLSTNLPVGAKPTTTTVTIIRPSKDLECGAKYYRLAPSGETIEIDWMEFDSLVQKEDAAETLILEVPQCEYLPDGVMVVDTPGEGSLTAESAITQAYLAEVDAAVFCIPAVDGTLHGHAKDFIANPALRRAHSRMVFAVTMSDLKQAALPDGRREIDVVKSNIVSELKKMAAEGKFCGGDIEKRVVCVSSAKTETGDGGAGGLLSALKTFVYGKGGDVEAERRQACCRELAVSAAAALEEMAEAMSFNPDERREKLDGAEADRRDVMAKLAAKEESFEEFRSLLPERMANAFDAHAPELVVAKSQEDLDAVAKSAVEDIEAAIKRLAKVKLGDENWTLDHSFNSQIKAALPAMLARIDRTAKGLADLAFIALSSGLAAAVPGGAAATGGAARGTAAVATKAAAKSTVRAAQYTAARTVAPARAAKSAEVRIDKADVANEFVATARVAKSAEVGKKSTDWAGILGKGAGILAEAIDKLNPASYVADWASSSLKEREVAGFRSRLMAIADSIADLIWEEYDALVLEPVRKSLAERKAAVAAICADIDTSRRDFSAKRQEIEADIAALKAIQ